MSTDPPKKKTTPHYSDKTRRKAINMVLNFGHSCDSAGKAVGCNGSTVKRWLIAHFEAKKVIAPQEKAALRDGLKALIAYKQKKLIDILSIRFIDMRKKPSKEKCALIAKHSNKYPVQILCDALNVDRSTFSRYLNPRPNLTAQRLESLIAETLSDDHHVHEVIDLLQHTGQKQRPIEPHYMHGGIAARKVCHFSTHLEVRLSLRAE